jgi:hypothetical protein
MNTTVTIDKWTAGQIEKYSVKCGISKKEFLTKTFEYFNRNGIDPVNDEAPLSELSKIKKDIEFIKKIILKQEKEFLFPALARIEANTKNTVTKEDANKILNDFNKAWHEFISKINSL